MIESTGLLAKITPPTLERVYPRKKLFARLKQLRGKTLIWISGPAGCGKTTLIRSYLQSQELPCLWVQMDRGDGDPATFFYYLGLAARKAFPGKRRPPILLTPEYLQDIPTFSGRFFENITRGLRIPTAFVLDNYHEIPVETPLHELILTGLSAVPEGIQVFIISRADPPPLFTGLLAQNRMAVLGWKELKLSRPEFSGIARLKAVPNWNKEAGDALYQMTDGWAAGLVLLLESLRRMPLPPVLEKMNHSEILDYFGSQLFDKTEKEIQDFFLKTAFLPKMTVRMAERLSNSLASGTILSRLRKNNYFLEAYFEKETVYQYHPLFREFLMSRAQESLPAAALMDLQRQAAELLEENGQFEAALSLLQDTGDWNRMMDLLLKVAPHMTAQGRNLLLKEWLEGLPGKIREGHPWLLYWMGICRLPFDPTASRPYFEKAYQQFEKKKESEGLFLSWSGIVEAIWFAMEDFHPLDHWLSVLEDWKPELEKLPEQEIKAQVTSSLLIALMVRHPEHPAIEEWETRALSFLNEPLPISLKIQILFRSGFYRMFMGDLGKMALAVRALQQMARSREASPHAQIGGKFAETFYHRVMGNHALCLKALSAGQVLSRKFGIHFMDRMFLVHGTFSALDAGDLPTARGLLETMGSSSHLSYSDQCYYHLLRAWERLFSGEPIQATPHAETALKMAFEIGVPYSQVNSMLMMARVSHELKKPREAGRYLKQALALAEKIKSKFYLYYVYLVKAWFSLDKGEEEKGLAWLRQAFLLAREEGFSCVFFQPPVMANLCVKALEAGIESEYLQEFVKRRQLVPKKPPLHLERWPWPLKVFTLGEFRLERDGTPLPFSWKVQQKPLALLKALISFKGQEVREDQLTDALWPEADGDLAHESLATTLHRLRKLIGYEQALQLREGRLSLDARLCWLDAWAFETILEEGELYWQRGEFESARPMLERAVQLYQGTFLVQEIEQPWMIPMRERLRNKYLRVIERLARYFQESSRWDRALECFQKGLEADDLMEELYQGLMLCYQSLGRKAEALAVYHRCRRIISAALGIAPSPKTEEIYRALRN